MRPDEDQFHDWLDDLVEGRRGDLPEQASPEFGRATSAASDLHVLATANSSIASNWEGLLMEHQKVESISSGAISRFPVARINVVNRLLSVAAVMAIVIGLMGTAWIYVDRRGGGSGDNDSSLAASATPYSTIQISIGETNNGDFMPKREDCDVVALSDEDVISKLSATDGPFVELQFDTESRQLNETSATELMAAHALYVACSYFGTLAQVAALETNDYFVHGLVAQTMPFVSSSYLLAALKEDLATPTPMLEAGFSNWSLPEDTLLPIAEGYPAAIQYDPADPSRVKVSMWWFDMSRSGIYKPDIRAINTGVATRTPMIWVYVKDAATGRWLLDSVEYPPYEDDAS